MDGQKTLPAMDKDAYWIQLATVRTMLLQMQEKGKAVSVSNENGSIVITLPDAMVNSEGHFVEVVV